LVFVAVVLNPRLQLKRYDACCPLFKDMCAFELKYKHEQQIYVDFIELLGLKKTAAVVQRLTHSQLMKMVLVWQKMTLKLVVEQEKASFCACEHHVDAIFLLNALACFEYCAGSRSLSPAFHPNRTNERLRSRRARIAAAQRAR
jgi:hypothetical protein